MIKEAIAQLVDLQDLTAGEAARVMNEILTGTATEAQIGAFLTAMRMKGEKNWEIASFARVLRSQAVTVTPGLSGSLVDTCGTGGDASGTFNISTVAAIIAAAAGVPIVKHGNRGVSSRCGSADLLEELGIPLEMEPARVRECVEKCGIGFFYAPLYHGAMRHAAG
ncbi:MAG: anthranilate phosphoribosyltransferase, partial [Methanoregulaceae archaeon]|nr:anthranilate phosphoribosyltransferase [Methanoregulaceae archaeon]